jgi:hypothetical protein
MSRKNKLPLAGRVEQAAEAALAANKYVRAIDVFTRMGWLYPGAEKDWQIGRLETIEGAMQAPPERIATAMEHLRTWAGGKRLLPIETEYVSRTPARETLRFCKSEDAVLERLYRTRWTSPALPHKERVRLESKVSRPPELVVIQPLKDDWKCHRCDSGEGLLMMEKPGPVCLRCAGLGDLEFLPAGDALLTRRAKAKSARHAVVVRFSRQRRRYERQGLLVEPRALEEAQRELQREQD